MSGSAADVIVALASSRRAVQLYPPSHPAFGEALDALELAVRSMTADGGGFVLNLHQGRLYNGSLMVPDDVNGVRSVAEAFETRGIESLNFSPSFTRADGLGLVEVLTLKPGPGLDVEAELASRNVSSVTVAFVEELKADAEEIEERDLKRQRDRALYNRVIAVLRTLSQGLAAGANADSDLTQATELVGSVLGRLGEDPFSVMALATIRGVGERTLFHSLNVMIYSLALGHRLGLPDEGLSALGTAAMLHDIGKSAFDENDPSQAEAMRLMHPQVGAEILERLSLADPAPMLVAYEHHMHVDGTGFPARQSDYIAHPYSRMVAIADRYENLTNPAPDRAALTPDRAIVQVLREAGSMLDPFFARLFASALGVFPVGSMVRLTDHSVGIVTRPGEDPLAPVVRLSYAADGAELAEQPELDLASGDIRIVEVIAQESLNVEVSEKL